MCNFFACAGRYLRLIALAPIVLSSVVFGQTTGYDVMQAVRDQARQHADQRYDIFMEIKDKKKRVRKRYFLSWNKYGENKTLGLVRFYRPANLAGTGMLSTRETGQDSHQWIYLPAFQSIKKLSRSDRNKSFMGSDFSHADIGGRELDEDVHTLISEDEKTYRINSVPKSKEDTYGRIEYSVHKSLKIITEAAFYDRQDQIIKILTSRKVKPHEGMYVVVDSVMKNPTTGSQTVLEIKNIDTKISRPHGFYSTIGLRQ